MDKIKHAARSNAWYNAEDGAKVYNPFGRYRAGGRPRDEENIPITHIQTENDAPSPTETKRREIADRENAPYARPGKSNTFAGPDNDTWDAEQGEISSGSGSTEKKTSEDTATAPVSNTTTQDPEKGGIVDDAVGSNNSTKKPRRRKFAQMFHKKKDSEDINGADDDEKKKKKKVLNPNITLMSQIKAVLFSWINILLVAVPVGIALGNVDGLDGTIVFVVNFIAIIPLAAMLSYSTEELAMYVGETLGGLLNASFGNAVELIVSIIALVKQETLIVQTSLVGSMLSNLLLVLGMCFFFGGINRIEQNFNLTVAQTAASLLALAIGSLIIPTTFNMFEPQITDGATPFSRGTAVLLLVVYACYLVFQLRTHKEVYNEPSEKVPKKKSGRKDTGDAIKGIATVGAASGAATAGGKINAENLVQTPDDDEEEIPQLTRLGALISLAVSTVFVALCAEYMVDGINDLTQKHNVSEEFVGLILLPIVGNAAEHATAVTVAIKDKMDLAIGVAVGSSLQIALLVLPLMILLNWFGVGAPADLNLVFNGWLVVVLVLSIWLVNYLINDGKSHWLEGVMLMITYIIIAVGAWFFPADPNQPVAG